MQQDREALTCSDEYLTQTWPSFSTGQNEYPQVHQEMH